MVSTLGLTESITVPMPSLLKPPVGLILLEWWVFIYKGLYVRAMQQYMNIYFHKVFLNNGSLERI